MIKKFFTDESLTTLVDEIKSYTDTNISDLSDGFSGVIYQMYGDDLTDDGAPTIREIAINEADKSFEDSKSYIDPKIANLNNNLSSHTDNKSNPHGINKSQIGLGNVDNTADADKNVKSSIEDADGQVISDTYIKNLSVSGQTITYTYGNNTTETITTQDTTYTSLKNPYSLTIQGNGTTLTNGTYDGSGAKTVNITPDNIGAAKSSHTHSAYAASNHSHDDKYYTESEIDAKFDAIIGEGASETLDTIGEISAAITDNQDMLDTLNSAIGNKANASDLSSHTSNTTTHITSTERTNWNAAKTHADSDHAPSNAQKNQNAFGMITCGDVDHMATSETSSFEILGDGIGVSAGTGKHADIAITLSNTGVLGVKGSSESSYRKGNVNITAANIGLGNVENKSSSTIRGELTKSNVTTALGYTPPTQDTATTSASGLMSATDKSKLDGIEDGANKYTLPTASSSTLGGVKIGSNISISSGKISVPAASGTTAGVTIVYPSENCTTYASDSGTCTPLAVQNAAKKFAITRPSSSTNKAITRYSNTTGDVQDSKIIIEDVTNTKDSSKKAQVIAIPAEGGKKMVYGYCTDQVDGTSFIGGVFDASATEYPYSSGLAIGGTSGNLLWKGKRVLDNDDLTAINTAINSKGTSNLTIGTTSTTAAAGNHTHKYAGASSAGGSATSAVKLDTATAGSATQPVYFTGGKPTACTYTLGKSVPSDAKFTDTVYTLPAATSSTLGGVKVGSNISVSSGTISLTKDNVVAALGYTPPTSDTNTDTQVTNTLATTTKAYVTGTSTATTNTGTQVFDTGVYLDTTAGRLTATSFKVGNAVLSYNSSKGLVITVS